MIKQIFITIILSSNFLYGQIELEKIVGEYSDDLGGIYTTKLQLNNDSTFIINTVDPEFPYTYHRFENSGYYTVDNNKVILNPNLKPRDIQVDLDILNGNHHSDSLQFNINYEVTYYNNNELDTILKFKFETLTIIINKKKNSTHLTRQHIEHNCAFSRKVKNQIIVDESNSFKLAKQDVERIGIFSYGFDKIKWIDVTNANANNFEINVSHPIDRERMPRSKEILMKKKKAYYYETDGKIDKWLTPLKRKTSR